jgi:vacuolar protein-sorting-associated protein 4
MSLVGQVSKSAYFLANRSLKGLEAAKERLQENVVFSLRFPDLFSGTRKALRGMLLCGPPGSGNSFLAKAIVTEVDSTLFSILASDLISK